MNCLTKEYLGHCTQKGDIYALLVSTINNINTYHITATKDGITIILITYHTHTGGNTQ